MLSARPPIGRCAHSVCLALCAVSLVAASPAIAGTPITLFRSYAGNIQYTGTAGTLRAQPNSGNACALNSSSSAPLSGLPAGAVVRAAFLYWAGSGSSVDAAVTFTTPSGSTTVAASRTFTETFPLSGTNYDFFSGFADVTARVAASGNGTYGLSGLAVNAGAPHCSVSAVVAGWSVIVIYEHASQPLRVVNLFDGFQYFRGGQISLTPKNFVIPPAPIDGQLSHLTWEGDVENSAPLGGFSEALRFDGNILADALNPTNNQFNSTVNTIPTSASYGVDFDIYDISPHLSPGKTSGNSLYSSGGDLVLLSAEVFSVTNTPVADLQLNKTHSGDFGVGVPETYTLLVTNGGPSPETGPVTVTDTLPAGLTYSASSGLALLLLLAASREQCLPRRSAFLDRAPRGAFRRHREPLRRAIRRPARSRRRHVVRQSRQLFLERSCSRGRSDRAPNDAFFRAPAPRLSLDRAQSPRHRLLASGRLRRGF